MWTNESRSLPDWIEDAYEIVVSQTIDRPTGLSPEWAQTQLLAHDAFPDDPADAEYALTRLLDYGWLYEVDDELRITDPDY